MSAKDQPLEVKVNKGVLSISIGIDTLSFCFEESEYNNPCQEIGDSYEFVRQYKIKDSLEFAKDVRRALLDEREDGSTILTDLLDKACEEAVDQGSLGIDYNE